MDYIFKLKLRSYGLFQKDKQKLIAALLDRPDIYQILKEVIEVLQKEEERRIYLQKVLEDKSYEFINGKVFFK
jgi:hypothetical protein